MSTDTRDEPPSIGERYTRAINSGNLRPDRDNPLRGEIGLLIAAGKVSEGMSTILYRLRSEVDDSAGELRLYQAEVNRLVALQNAAIVKTAGTKDAERAAEYREQAAALGLQADREALSGRAMMMLRLKTLNSAKEALGRFARQHATRARFMRPDKEVAELAGKALDLFLSPNCPRCEGRGKWGGYDSPVVLCPPPKRGGCNGTGKRSVRDVDGEGARFVNSLLSEMERKLSSLDAQMNAFLKAGRKWDGK